MATVNDPNPMTDPDQPELDPEVAIASIERLDTTSNGDRRKPLSQAIASRLRDAIIDGRLPPGMAIRQEILASHLGTSRIPVREALRKLETEGMLTLVPHSGARVARLDLAEHVELYRIREALEPLAIAESALRLSDEQLQELRELATLIEDSRDDLQAWIQHDRTFHLASYAAAPFPRLLRMIHGFWNTTQHYRRAHVSNFDRRAYEIIHAEHRMILEALERHDPVDAEERQRSHIRRTRIELTAHAEEIFGESASRWRRRAG
ncbi:MAG TPA: GntR family transcriptional regulator [Solirubrobacteraceae bacterium]|jgi:DNA-binding GntR family transcriptional regulator